jgi:fructosamine-3-kinase
MIAQSVIDWLEAEKGLRLRPSTARSVSGGCINEAHLAETEEGALVFLKSNQRHQLTLFEAETKSLEQLRSAGAIRVPAPLCHGVVEEMAVLALEGIVMTHRTNNSVSQERLGLALANLHQSFPQEEQFGADFDNHIGATPQPNPWTASWADFFTAHRLEYQFQLAESKCHKFREARTLLDAVHTHLSSLDIVPSLLHGDLWSGNVNFDETGAPVVFDPAAYFGDREADIAFTHLFGGFGPDFYQAYRSQIPPVEPIRGTIYNLYHLLNHFNLFGGSYASQVDSSIQKILSNV